MDYLFSVELTVKLSHLILMLTLCTVAFVYGMTKMALLICYAFAFYWGYIANFEQFFSSNIPAVNQMCGFYFAFGILVFILSMVSFFVYRE